MLPEDQSTELERLGALLSSGVEQQDVPFPAGCVQEERALPCERGALGGDEAAQCLHVQDQVRIQDFHL